MNESIHIQDIGPLRRIELEDIIQQDTLVLTHSRN